MRFGDQPALTGPMEGHCELDLTVKPSGGDDVGRTPLDYVQFPRQGIEVTGQFHQNHYDNRSNMMVDSAHPNDSVVSKTDANLFDVRNDVHKVLGVSEMFHPAVNADYHKSQFDMNFTPIRGEAASNHLAWSHRPEAQTSYSQISGNFSNSGCRTSMLSHTENASVRGNKNDVNATALQFGHPGIADGAFLRLGIGGGVEMRSNHNFSAQEISRRLKEAHCSPHHSYHVQKTGGNPLAQSTDRAARLPFNGGGLSNMVSGASTCEGGGLISGVNPLILSNPCYSSQIPQADIQRNLSSSIDHGSGLRHDQNPLPLLYNRTLMSHPGYAVPSLLTSELTKPTHFASQPMSGQRESNCRKSHINLSPGSSLPSPVDWQRGNSIRHSQLRNLIPLTDGSQTQISDGASFPVSVEPLGNLATITEGSTTDVANICSSQTSVQPTGELFSPQNVSPSVVHGYHLFPGTSGFPISKGSKFQSVVSDPFPRRLGVQPVDFPAARTGPSHVALESLVSHINPGHTVLSGQHLRGMPSHLPKDIPKVNYTNGHLNPAAQFGAQPRAFPIPYHHRSLKRGADEMSTTTHSNQRRRIIPGPVIHQSVPQRRIHIPAPSSTLARIPSAPFHIKIQGFDGSPKPCGYKCLLCKRDLSFTAEGQVYQPAVPPPVAVLPCGHTFHESCLEMITPADQSKHPTCIPCATGDT